MLQFLRKLLVITFFGTLISTHFLYSQNTSTFWDKVRVGGGFGLNFGSDFLVGHSPQVPYMNLTIILLQE